MAGKCHQRDSEMVCTPTATAVAPKTSGHWLTHRKRKPMFSLQLSPFWEYILHSQRCGIGMSLYLGAGSWVAAIHPTLAGHCIEIW